MGRGRPPHACAAEYGLLISPVAPGIGITLQVARVSGAQHVVSAGNVTDRYSYFAFGEELSASGSTVNEFRNVGEQFDPNAGFYYNRARWYSPSVGRFTSVDPFAGDKLSPVTLHRYLYGNASPITYSDPGGEITILDVFFAGALYTALTSTYFYFGRLKSKEFLPALSRPLSRSGISKGHHRRGHLRTLKKLFAP